MTKQKINKKGQFVKGMIPWNKGKRGYMGANIHSFTSERVRKERTKYKTGEAQKAGKCGHFSCRTEGLIERKDNNTGKIYLHHKRKSYCKYLMESLGYIIPKGYVVYHIDGNTENNNIENLKIISRAELLKLNRKQKKNEKI